MHNLGHFIKIARKKAGYTQNEFSKLLGIGRSSLAQYEADIYKPNIDILKQMAEILDTTIDALSGVEIAEKPVKTIPVVGITSCGNAIEDCFQEKGRSCYYNGEFWTPKLYAIVACGESMSPEIDDGDEIICDPDAKIESGDIVHYRLHNETAVKVYNYDKDNHIIELIPYNPNPDFKTKVIRLESDEADEIIYHKVVAVNKLLFNSKSARLKKVGR